MNLEMKYETCNKQKESHLSIANISNKFFTLTEDKEIWDAITIKWTFGPWNGKYLTELRYVMQNFFFNLINIRRSFQRHGILENLHFQRLFFVALYLKHNFSFIIQYYFLVLYATNAVLKVKLCFHDSSTFFKKTTNDQP